MNLVADVSNEALDAIGAGFAVGDIGEGTDEAQIVLRKYGQCVRQLFRAANWTFARKQVDLVLLAQDANITAGFPNPAVGTIVQPPWRFAYEYPNDCMRVRFIPHRRRGWPTSTPQGNIAIPPVPLTTGFDQSNHRDRLHPARFLVGFDTNYPPAPQQIYWETQGVAPTGRVVIMTDVAHAQAVYTGFIPYPSVWDALFRAALVAFLAAEIALPIWAKKKDPKFGLALRREQIALMGSKINAARVADGNEGVTSSDISVDWIRTRVTAGGFSGFGRGGDGFGYGGEGPGIFSEGFSDCGMGNSSAY